MKTLFNNTKLAVLSGFLAGLSLCSPALAQTFTYNYVGGAVGYVGTVVLDANVSPPGGGSVADIVSISVTTPTYGTVLWDPSDQTAQSGQFTWDSSGISLMNITWITQTNGSFSANVASTARLDTVAISGGSGFITDFKGKWVAAPVPVVEPLAISQSGTNVVVSWPTNTVVFQLQSSSVLGTNVNWASVTNSSVINSTNYNVTLPVLTGIQFFRLQGTN